MPKTKGTGVRFYTLFVRLLFSFSRGRFIYNGKERFLKRGLNKLFKKRPQNYTNPLIIIATFYSAFPWLYQKRIKELFGCNADNISLHIKNIFKKRLLEHNSVAEEISVTAKVNY